MGGMGQAAGACLGPAGPGPGVTSKPRAPSLPTWWAIWRRMSRLPVIPGDLHYHRGHLPAPQPVRQREHLLLRGAEAAGLGHLPRRVLIRGHPDRRYLSALPMSLPHAATRAGHRDAAGHHQEARDGKGLERAQRTGRREDQFGFNKAAAPGRHHQQGPRGHTRSIARGPRPRASRPGRAGPPALGSPAAAIFPAQLVLRRSLAAISRARRVASRGRSVITVPVSPFATCIGAPSAPACPPPGPAGPHRSGRACSRRSPSYQPAPDRYRPARNLVIADMTPARTLALPLPLWPDWLARAPRATYGARHAG